VTIPEENYPAEQLNSNKNDRIYKKTTLKGTSRMYEIGGKEFKTLGKAQVFCKDIYDQYEIGDTVSEEHKNWLIAALKFRGTDGNRKIGCGVERIYIIKNPYNRKSFCIERTDGSTTDFGFTKIFQRKTDRIKISAALKDFTEACRTAISPQMREMAGLEHKMLAVHHADTPFEQLVKDFIKEYNIDVTTVKIIGHNDMEMRRRFTDHDLEQRWTEYHNAHATLVVISKEDHKKEHGAANSSK